MRVPCGGTLGLCYVGESKDLKERGVYICCQIVVDGGYDDVVFCYSSMILNTQGLMMS